MPDRYYTVTINRWDAYRVYKVMAGSETEAEEIALRIVSLSLIM